MSTHPSALGDAAKKLFTPTVKEIVTDRLTQLSLEYWLPGADGKPTRPFDPSVVEDIYRDELRELALPRIMLLELSHYLEAYLWPNFDSEKSSLAHVLSMLVLINEKFRESVLSPWKCFHDDEQRFGAFFDRVLKLRTEGRPLTTVEETVYIVFLINCFQSLENPMLRAQCLKLVYLPLWLNVTKGRAEAEVKALPPRLQERWRRINSRASTLRCDPQASFFPDLIQFFLTVLQSITEEEQEEKKKEEVSQKIAYCERFVEWMIDLMSQLPTRRFFYLTLDDSHMLIKCRRSSLAKRSDGRLFNALVEMLQFYAGFEVNNLTGEALIEEEVVSRYSGRLEALQRSSWRLLPEKLRDLALANLASIQSRPALIQHLSSLSTNELRRLCAHLHLLPPNQPESDTAEPEGNPSDKDEDNNKQFLLELLVARHETRPSQLEALNKTPLYPNEDLLWDENVVPSLTYTGEGCLALPKLNLQFLTLHDYLLRNCTLFRLEATYGIRQDIEDAVRRMNPRKALNGSTVFQGWARMALPIKQLKLISVKKPHLGESKPASVLAEVSYTISESSGGMRDEWESLKQHDVLYLVTVRSPVTHTQQHDKDLPFSQQYGVIYCRGCEVERVTDEAGNEVGTGIGQNITGEGQLRKARVWLDTAQYAEDMRLGRADDVYSSLNLVIRRRPKENNFKAILQTIRQIINTPAPVPQWLHDVFLGYGDPGAATARTLTSDDAVRMDFVDTFLDFEHARASFPTARVVPRPSSTPTPPFLLEFSSFKEEDSGPCEQVVVEAYQRKSRGPYPYNQPRRNTIPFTPRQVQAIRSAMGNGLTMVVGPPGTGKTDVAVQIISNWYHNYPDQRTLLVTHSNQALNQLFEKIIALDIDERYLLRLGHGQKMLETEKDFSKHGRVNFMLERRLHNLSLVGRLAESVGASGEFGWSCETAAHLLRLHVAPAWSAFKAALGPNPTTEDIVTRFPFTRFFNDLGRPLFCGSSVQEHLEIARGCYRYIKDIFRLLEECRALELLRNGTDRGNYLLTRHARVVAMTCTHAALKRDELAALGFHYDNVLMEEAAQILEIETFIPLVLQEKSSDHDSAHELKRVVLIGDHNQLPPVVRNMAFQRYAHLDQSLFARFVRLGVPTIMLDAQGRSRPSLAALFNWRYPSLGDLPVVLHEPQFLQANAGLRYEYQVIDVGDFQGRGEYEPSPYFYQNLGEAEYLVAVYQYMRLLGYPASKISVITSYNGQKHLLRDVFRQRCANHPIYGMPQKISTLDRFQGQQNDYILFSMVRTRAVGHIRDVRRLVVGMSRARLGLYVFCRKALFENCYELTPSFARLLTRPSQLTLVANETYPTTRALTDDPTAQSFTVQSLEHMQALVATHAQRLFTHHHQQQQQELPTETAPESSKRSLSTSLSEEDTSGNTSAGLTEQPQKKRKIDDDDNNEPPPQQQPPEQANAPRSSSEADDDDGDASA